MIFIKKIENFTCGHCGASVQGSGYTNHCPRCLWSRHVDVAPGDRAASCGGMMEPLALEGSSPDYRILHRCTVCDAQRRVRTAPNDARESLVALAAKRGGVA